MKTLLIPPIPHLDLAQDRDMHLTLAHLYQDPRYSSFYRQEATKGKYIILDNSAHETQVGQPIHGLIEIARDVYASEIVLPDHLFDAKDTRFRTKQALDYLIYHLDECYQSNYHYMIVPQGNNLPEYLWCLAHLLRDYSLAQQDCPTLFQYAPVIGVSKDYEVWEGGLYDLLQNEVLPRADNYPGTQIHLLGWGRDLWKLRRISDDFGTRIRSVDSAKPFVYASAGVVLIPDETPPEYPKRSHNYFYEALPPLFERAAMLNITAFDSTVGVSEVQK